MQASNKLEEAMQEVRGKEKERKRGRERKRESERYGGRSVRENDNKFITGEQIVIILLGLFPEF